MKKLLVLLLILVFASASIFADDGVTSESSETGDRPRVALVLAGGGAKGIAHIPIIAALEEYGIPIDKVFGTSMGALVGGLYCAGHTPQEMIEIVSSNDLMSLFTTIDSSGYREMLGAFEYNTNNIASISLSQGIGGVSGIIDDYQILNFIQKCVGNVPEDIDFDADLPVAFECNSANMLTGDEIIFREGSLMTAMRSSMSLPLVFEPVILDDGTVLMDGGIVSNYIVHRAVEEGYDIIICVTLDGYGKNPLTKEDYTSLSGVLGSTLSIVLNNVSKDELDNTTYLFSPDMTGLGTLSFRSVEEILQRGYDEVAAQKDKFEAIAACFTEEQKEYKDPDRIGEYTLRFPHVQRSAFYSSAESRHEDTLGRTRLSIGLYGNAGFGFYLDEADTSSDRRFFIPTLSIRTFIKDISGTPISLDTRLKIRLDSFSELSAMGLFRLSDDHGVRTSAFVRPRLGYGTLSAWTDGNEDLSFNLVEGFANADLGIMVSDESTHMLQVYLTAENKWTASKSHADDKPSYIFLPSATMEFLLYRDYTSGFFAEVGGRVDFKAYFGYNPLMENYEYRLSLSGSDNIQLSDSFAMWFEGTAVSNRGIATEKSTYGSYGGWLGMPGYANISAHEFMNAGVGLQYRLSDSFVSSYLALVLKAGIRSYYLYGTETLIYPDLYDMVPFSYCFGENRVFDYGASLGYGFSTPIGDFVIGVGFNNHLQLAIYFELI